MRIQPEYMSFKNRCTISSSYKFQAHQQRFQRRYCFSQHALLWFEVLPDAPRCSAIHRDPSPGQQKVCKSPSEGTRFRQSHQSRPEHPGCFRRKLELLLMQYTVLCVCCTWCQLIIMTSRSSEGWHNFFSCKDGRVMDDKERDGGWRWERCGGY